MRIDGNGKLASALKWLNGGAGADLALAVFAVFAAYRLVFSLATFDAMAVPEFDFFGFREVAAGMARLEVPTYFKRGPLYPLLMTAWPFRFADADRFLQGAEVVNLLAALGALLMVYRWGRGVVGRGAALAAVIVGCCSLYPEFTAQPLCEMTFLFFILAAVAGAGRGTGWAYLAAGAAAATRYEAIVIVPLVLAADAGWWRRKPRLFLFAVAALAPVGAWLLAGALRGPAFNPYVAQMVALPPTGVEFFKTLASVLYPAAATKAVFLSYVLIAVAVVGAVYLVARGGAGARVYAGFVVFYVVVHLLFPFSFSRFVLPIFPFIAVSLVAGGRVIFRGAAGVIESRRWVWFAGGAVLAAWAAGVAVWSRPAAAAGTGRFWGAYALPLAFVVAAVAAALWPRRGAFESRVFAGASVALAVLTLYVNAQTRSWAGKWDYIRWHGASVRATAEWLGNIGGAGDKVCTAWPGIVAYYSAPAGLSTVRPAAVRRGKKAPFPERAGKARVQFLCYDSISSESGYVNDLYVAWAGVTLLEPFAAGQDVGRYYFIAKVETPGEYVYVYRLAVEPPRWKPAKWPDEEEEG